MSSTNNTKGEAQECSIFGDGSRAATGVGFRARHRLDTRHGRNGDTASILFGYSGRLCNFSASRRIESLERKEVVTTVGFDSKVELIANKLIAVLLSTLRRD